MILQNGESEKFTTRENYSLYSSYFTGRRFN